MCQDCEYPGQLAAEEPPEGYYDTPLTLSDRLRAWWHRNDPPYSDDPPF